MASMVVVAKHHIIIDSTDSQPTRQQQQAKLLFECSVIDIIADPEQIIRLSSIRSLCWKYGSGMELFMLEYSVQ